MRNAGDRIRTYEGTKPLGPKPSPFDRSGTPALKCELSIGFKSI